MDTTNERSCKMQRDDDNASHIAEKLLEGWTLLAEYCPMEGCLAPLMRSRDGRKYCVAHDMFVMTPEEAEAMKISGNGVGEATPSRAAPTPAAEPPMERIDFYKNLKTGAAGGGGGDGGTPASRLGRAAAAAPASMDVATLGYSGGGGRGSAAARGVGGGGGEGVVDVKATAQRTVETLAGKMEEARVILAASRDFAQCSELIRFVEECAAAIKSCEGI